MLLVDGDPADSALGVRLADVAEVVAVLAHSDGWAQVLAAGPALESLNQPLGDLVNCLLNTVGHLDDMLKSPLSCCEQRTKQMRLRTLSFPIPARLGLLAIGRSRFHQISNFAVAAYWY